MVWTLSWPITFPSFVRSLVPFLFLSLVHTRYRYLRCLCVRAPAFFRWFGCGCPPASRVPLLCFVAAFFCALCCILLCCLAAFVLRGKFVQCFALEVHVLRLHASLTFDNLNAIDAAYTFPHRYPHGFHPRQVLHRFAQEGLETIDAEMPILWSSCRRRYSQGFRSGRLVHRRRRPCSGPSSVDATPQGFARADV